MEAAIEAVEEAIKGDDKSVIDEQTRKLTEVAGKMAEKAYQQAGDQEARAAGGGNGAGAGAQGANGGGGDNGDAKPSDENVVDAEFEEVNDDKKS